MAKVGLLIATAILCLLTVGVNTKKLTQKLYVKNGNNPYRIFGTHPASIKQRADFYVSKWTGVAEALPDCKTCPDHVRRFFEKGAPDQLLEKSKAIVQLRVAATFKNNLIKAFGYVLHRKDMELNSALYTSLFFILQTIKLNQVNIISMVPILSALSFKSSNERFKAIFEALEKHLPEYLTCSATLWKEAIVAKQVNMNNIMKPYRNGPLVVDVLDMMTKEMLDLVHEETTPGAPQSAEETKVLYNFNVNVLEIMRYIKQHKSELDQIFFGGLLQFFPKNTIQPDLEESIQVVVEYLEQNNVPNWSKEFADLSPNQLENPEAIIKHVLLRLVVKEGIPLQVKDSAQIIMSNLGDRNPTAINPYYASVTGFIPSTDVIHVPNMLNYVEVGAFPHEVIIAAYRIRFYLAKGYIRPLTFLLNFNPYFYSTPTEIIIALLDRIIKREPDLSTEIASSVAVVYSYLTFFYRYITFPPIMPDDMVNMNLLTMGLINPELSKGAREKIGSVINHLQGDSSKYDDLIINLQVYKYPTPLIGFIQLLEVMKDKKVPADISMEDLITYLPNGTCVNGNCRRDNVGLPTTEAELFPSDCIDKALRGEECPPDSPVMTPDQPTGHTDAASSTLKTTTTTTTTVRPPVTPTEGSPKTAATSPSTRATTPSASTARTEIDPILTGTAPTDPGIVVTVFPQLDPKAKFTKKMLMLLRTDKYKDLLSGRDHASIVAGYLVFLKSVRLIEQKVAEGGNAAEFHDYLVATTKMYERIVKVLKYIYLEKEPTEPNLAKLIIAVPAPVTGEDNRHFGVLVSLLQRQEIFKFISHSLKNEDYRNIASLLKKMLAEAGTTRFKAKFSDEERAAAAYYVSKIKELGFGQTKIIWGVNVEQIKKTADIAQTMNMALGFKQLDNKNRKRFNSILGYLKKEPSILQSWNHWVLYSECGNFTKAMFELLLNHAGTLPRDVRDAINSLTPLINYDNDGAKLVVFKHS